MLRDTYNHRERAFANAPARAVVIRFFPGGASFVRGGKGERVERIYRELRAVAIAGGSEEVMQDLAVREAMKRWDAQQQRKRQGGAERGNPPQQPAVHLAAKL